MGRHTVSNEVGYRFMGVGKNTQCNTGASQSYPDIADAATCADVCAAEGNLSATLLIMGLNYDCGQKTCECLYGTQWEKIDEYVSYVNGYVQCYKQTPFPCKYNSKTNHCVGYNPGHDAKYLRLSWK